MNKAVAPLSKARKRPVRREDSWQSEKSSLTRAAILDAAIGCLVEIGYANTTTAMIAERAGVSRGAMMHHFPSRLAVITALVEYLHQKRLEEYTTLMKGIDVPGQQITRKAIRASVEAAWHYVNLPSFVAYHELLAASRTDAALSAVLQRAENDYEVLFLKTVRNVFPHWEKLPVLELANDVVQFTMRGMALSHMSSKRPQRAKRMIEHVTDDLVRLYDESSAR